LGLVAARATPKNTYLCTVHLKALGSLSGFACLEGSVATTTCDAPKWWIWWQYRNSDLNSIKRATLEFCGFRPVRVKRIDRLRYKNESERNKILQDIKKFAKNA